MKTSFLCPILLIGLISISCQERKSTELTTLQKLKIDSLTTHWNQVGRPGGAIAILKEGKVIYKNILGYADVSLSKKNTDETGFQMGQISDSFIAYALLHLEATSTLSLDDQLSVHLPFISSLSTDIKVKHLLQQSSGIHDFEILKNIKGWAD